MPLNQVETDVQPPCIFSPPEFVERRRASLERYLNRTAGHPNLRVDPDFRYLIR